MSQIGTRARTIRLARGESQEAVARRADVATATILRIEHGKSEPSLDTARRLAEALEVTLEDLLGDSAA